MRSAISVSVTTELSEILQVTKAVSEKTELGFTGATNADS